MANWKLTIDVKSEWENLTALSDDDKYDEDKFCPMRDALVAKLRSNTRAVWSGTFVALVDELAEVMDIDEFDNIWGRLYDWADQKRVWIKTF